VIKQLLIRSRGFHCKAGKDLNSTLSTASLKMKFEGFFRAGLNLCWDGFRLCQTVVIARYILTYGVTLLADTLLV